MNSSMQNCAHCRRVTVLPKAGKHHILSFMKLSLLMSRCGLELTVDLHDISQSEKTVVSSRSYIICTCCVQWTLYS